MAYVHGHHRSVLDSHRVRTAGVRAVVADAHHLPLADRTFDVVHAHQVLQHLTDPVGALREWRRVLRPGGVVAARDADYAAFAWYPQIPALHEWLELYHAVARASGGEPDAGRRLLSWAQRAGFTDITATGSVWCYATDAQDAPGGRPGPSVCSTHTSRSRRSITTWPRHRTCPGSRTVGSNGPSRPTAGS